MFQLGNGVHTRGSTGAGMFPRLFLIALLISSAAHLFAKNPDTNTSDISLEPNTKFIEREAERLHELLEKIDPAKILSEKGPELIRDGSTKQALTALLEHYLHKTVNERLLPHKLSADKKTLRRAKRTLEGKHTMQGVPGNPLVKTGANGLYDWHYQGPNDDPEWAWFLNRHGFFRNWVAAALEQSKSENLYALSTSKVIMDWIRQNPVPAHMSFGAPWRALEAARRVEKPWLEAFYRLRFHPQFTPEARLMMLSSIPEHADYLMKHHSFHGNHKITEMMALLTLAVAWPEFTKADKWRKYATTQLLTQLKKQTYPDGSHKELANHYQRVVLLSFQRALTLLDIHGDETAKERIERLLSSMWSYFAHVMRPDGTGPLNSDSDLENNRKNLQKHAMPYYQREDWRWIITHGEEGTRPSGQSSRYFPWAGHAVMRRDWSKSTPWAFFDMGPHGIDHQHRDRLHLSVSLGQRPFLVDSGRYTYQPGKLRDYYKGPSAHNVVMHNEKGSVTPPDEVEAPLDNVAKIIQERDIFEAQVSFPQNPWHGKGRAVHRRRIQFEKGQHSRSLWIVTDTLIDYGASKWSTLWHFHPSCKLERSGLNVRTTFSKEPNLALIPIGVEADLKMSRGDRSPKYQGWYSPYFLQQKQSTTLRYVTRASNPVTHHWLLLPLQSGETIPRVKMENSTLHIHWPHGKSEAIQVKL